MHNLHISLDDYKNDVEGQFNPLHFDAENRVKQPMKLV